MSDYILDLISQGENQFLDFKYEINDAKKIAISLSAFCNTDGGRLLIGVKDNGKIKGLKSDEDFYMLQAAANMYSKPKIDLIIKKHLINNKTILEAIIKPGNNKPYLAKDANGKWIAYRRVIDKNRQADAVQLKVWKDEKSKLPVFFKYTAKEKILFDLLTKNKRISLLEYCSITNFPTDIAVKNIANLIRLDILLFDYSEETVHYTLNEKINLNDFR
ncbi:MAG: ATP-binding protein [Marinilabiliales bacterium]